MYWAACDVTSPLADILFAPDKETSRRAQGCRARADSRQVSAELRSMLLDAVARTGAAGEGLPEAMWALSQCGISHCANCFAARI